VRERERDFGKRREKLWRLLFRNGKGEGRKRARVYSLSEKREREKRAGQNLIFREKGLSLSYHLSLFSVVAAVVVVVRALSSARARRKEAPLPPSLGF
jgi:hypothetical protein